MQRVLEDEKHEKYHSNFINSLKSKVTKEDYDRRIQGFMRYLGIPKGNYADLVEGGKDRQTIEEDIIKYLLYLAEERKVRHASRVHYLAPLIAFYDLYPELEIRWKLVKKYLGSDDDELTEEQLQNGEGEEAGIDRPYDIKEIQDMVRNADYRTKVIILLIASCGVRVGGIPGLKIRNLKKIEKYGGLYQITVYEKSKNHRYVTFCTPECAQAIEDYLEYRKHAGEDVYVKNGASALIREQFNSADSFKVNNPRHIQTPAVAWLVNQVLTKYSAIKTKLEWDFDKNRRIGKNETMQTHALRKFFETKSRHAGVDLDIVEKLMGHKLAGTKKAYLKFTPQELLEGTKGLKGYIHAIPDLTINDESRLKLQNTILQKEVEDIDYIKHELKKKDEEVEEMQDQMKQITSTANRLYEVVQSLQTGEKKSLKHLHTASTGIIKKKEDIIKKQQEEIKRLKNKNRKIKE